MQARQQYQTRTPGNAQEMRTGRVVILARQEPVIHQRKAAPHTPDSTAADTNTTALTEAQREHYRNDGYLMLPDMFSDTEVARLNAEMQALRDAWAGKQRPEVISEPGSGDVRSIFDVHRLSKLFDRLTRDPRVLNVAREILGSEVYIHQSRINYKPGFNGKEFYWHSDFETWHSEDGMPAMRALSCTILLTDNDEFNGPLMLIPGSHRHFISCAGETPDNNYQKSLKKQEIGVPDESALRTLADAGGIVSAKGKAGSVIFFDCNTMHGSNSNITPYPRSNVFVVYNSMDNQLEPPQAGLAPRPEFIAVRRDISALRPEGL